MRSPAPNLAVVLLSSFALVLSLGMAGGCTKPAAKAGERQPSPGSEASGSAASSSTTRELEEKAAGYEERFKEIQESDMTADEKAQAAGELVDEQQRTIREAEDGTTGASEGDRQE